MNDCTGVHGGKFISHQATLGWAYSNLDRGLPFGFPYPGSPLPVIPLPVVVLLVVLLFFLLSGNAPPGGLPVGLYGIQGPFSPCQDDPQ